MARKRGAVVIGVNKTGGLTPLKSAAAGAEAVADWLKSEGFEVRVITDAEGKVNPQTIADAIAKFVEPGTFDQLVVCFSGHGFWKNDTELWLLSDAPADANAAISWAETAEFAKDCGVPNVVLISDACRSIPNTPQRMKVRGSIVFPNDEVRRSRAKVDKFMAAAMGTPAYEVPMGTEGQIESAFTHCFLNAFRRPDPDMIREVTEDGKTIEVVPNRRLGKYLQREVGALLASVNVQLEQNPDAEVLSDDDVYIGHAQISEAESLRTVHELGLGERERIVVHLRDVASVAIDRAMNIQPNIPTNELKRIEKLAQKSGFAAAVEKAQKVSVPSGFASETGFVVVGSPIVDAEASGSGRALIAEKGNRRNPGKIHVELAGGSACSVALHFANERGTVLPALHGYVGHIIVEGNSVAGVSYLPTVQSPEFQDDLVNQAQLDQLRAIAAAAMRHSVFYFGDQQAFSKLAEYIHNCRRLDPVLGLYAAYAYAHAGRSDEVEQISERMARELDVELFDVAMLARKLTHRPPGLRPVVPFCPMLTRGWNLLRAHGITLHQKLDEAQDELEQELWTTFKPARMKMILQALERREIP